MDQDNLEAWQWPEDTWRAHVERVRAGQSLLPKQWPDGAVCAVAISFDSDHETPSLRDKDTSPAKLAQGEYGARVAVPKILDMLQKRSIKASFFMPAVCALLRPSEARGYVDGGHEVALHGWIHERNTALTRADERELQLRSADTLERITGVRPTGIRTPSWDFSANTLAIIREMGLLYDSSLMADDAPYELLENAEPTGLVEVPVEWIRDDAPYFMMERFGFQRPYIAPSEVKTIWLHEYQAARDAGGVFQLTMHPHIIGHPSRLRILDELLDEITESRDVWFATHAELAAYCKNNSSPTFTNASTWDHSKKKVNS
jgi:peptidoglycan/xylan/chitin deacetylase (PgdA/CDA1 family)